MTGLYPDAPHAADVLFTDAARRVLAGAQTESDRLRHEFVGTEHLVLAMTQDDEATALLARLGIEAARVRATLEPVVRPGAATPTPGSARPYTSRTRQAFGLAAEAAADASGGGVGIEYLLVGLLSERESIGAQVLQHHGLSLEQAQAAARRTADDGTVGPA